VTPQRRFRGPFRGVALLQAARTRPCFSRFVDQSSRKHAALLWQHWVHQLCWRCPCPPRQAHQNHSRHPFVGSTYPNKGRENRPHGPPWGRRLCSRPRLCACAGVVPCRCGRGRCVLRTQGRSACGGFPPAPGSWVLAAPFFSAFFRVLHPSRSCASCPWSAPLLCPIHIATCMACVLYVVWRGVM
jgi:hypothetical protein